MRLIVCKVEWERVATAQSSTRASTDVCFAFCDVLERQSELGNDRSKHEREVESVIAAIGSMVRFVVAHDARDSLKDGRSPR